MTAPKSPITFEGTKRLLAYVQALTGRTFDVLTIKAWQAILAPHNTYDECAWAVTYFIRTRGGEYLNPGHLCQIINDKRAEYDHSQAGALYDADSWYFAQMLHETHDPRYIAELERRRPTRSAVEAMESGDYDD